MRNITRRGPGPAGGGGVGGEGGGGGGWIHEFSLDTMSLTFTW